MNLDTNVLPAFAESPFGGIADKVQTMRTSTIADIYKRKCGIDVTPHFNGHDAIGLYNCRKTGYKFWRPKHVAGNEDFYKALSAAWPNYYRLERWEHPFARRFLKGRESVLEIGSGPGHFLKTLEHSTSDALGIEFNREAIGNKVTRFPIRPTTIESLAEVHGTSFDAVFAFQVLEHVPDPCSMMKSALALLKQGGILMFSTPNNDCAIFSEQEDAFDLPPHHIGHFSAKTYEAIGRELGLKIIALLSQKRTFSPPATKLPSTRDSIAYKVGKAVARAAMNSAYKITGEPGENLLVVFEKN